MTGLSQALKDIEKYLDIEGIRNIKVEYGTETDYKTSKSVTLTFSSKDYKFMTVITRINSENM
tara:strand:+ start:222 stop:410 length:189 start_codon:yes stop_codon:yes gene_type:complete